jgi:excisionase family DNA binding protein
VDERRLAPRSLLSVREVATRLRVSTATVYKLVHKGELPHIRVVNTVRVRPTDLEAFVAKGRRQP